MWTWLYSMVKVKNFFHCWPENHWRLACNHHQLSLLGRTNGATERKIYKYKNQKPIWFRFSLIFFGMSVWLSGPNIESFSRVRSEKWQRRDKVNILKTLTGEWWGPVKVLRWFVLHLRLHQRNIIQWTNKQYALRHSKADWLTDLSVVTSPGL